MTARGAAATSSKLLVPRPPADTILRERLLDRLAAVTGARLTTVVAGTGFGKSTLLATWAGDANVAWYTVDTSDRDPRVLTAGLAAAIRVKVPGLAVDPAVLAAGSPADEANAAGLAGFLAASVAEHGHGDFTLVVDDAHELDGSPGTELLAALCRHAGPGFHLVLASQREAPFPIARLRAQSQVIEIDGGELAFAPDETAAVLLAGVPDADAVALVPAIQRATGGWPAAVRLTVASLRGRPAEHRVAALERLARPGGPIAELLAEEVFTALPDDELALVVTASRLDRFSTELLDAMGVNGVDAVPLLARAGVLVREEAEPGWYAVPALVRDFVAGRAERDGDVAARLTKGAAWLEQRGAHREALAVLRAAGDADAVAAYVDTHGRALVAIGAASDVLAAIGARADLVAAEVEARFASGDWDGVTAAVERFPPGPLPATVALRAGLVLHLRGRIHDALDVYSRGVPDDDQAAAASILAYRAAARWLLGDAERCRDDATSAMQHATAAGDDSALAAAHTVAAMIAAIDGDRAANQAHYVRALAYAEAAADVLQIIRIRTNRGSRAIEEGLYGEALVELDLAVDLAERSGYQSFAALALSNRGEAHLHLGRLDEAARDLDAAVTRYVALGSRLRAYPLAHLGDLHRLRGEVAQARVAYDHALHLAEDAADLQGLAPALGGLVELLIDDEPELAAELAGRALSIGPSLARPRVLWAAGLVAARSGRAEAVAGHADELAALGRERRDRIATALALELRALTFDDDRARPALVEARELLAALGDPVGEARATIALAACSPPAEATSLLDRAGETIRRLGARALVPALDEARRALGDGADGSLRIATLGGFRVARDGEPIAATAWQSRKARDLLKLLTTRLGRPVPREQICEALWPDEPAERRSSRLSVTLSTLRGVLDPERERDADRFVGADRDQLWLQGVGAAGPIEIDVERFLAAARAALVGGGSLDDLVLAESLYAGEYLDDEPYADWAVGLREEARALYLRVARRLAEQLVITGDTERAGHLYLRLLQRDPYDEAAHLALVRLLDGAGHRGEARRAYRAYTARMAELDVEPAAYPS